MEEEKLTLKDLNEMMVRILNLKNCYADVLIEIRKGQIVRIKPTLDFMTKTQIDNLNANLIM